MKKYIIIVLLLVASNGFCGDDWTALDTSFQATLLTLKAVDWLQTKEIARNPKYSETNFILGKYPKQNEVDLYFASSAIAHTVIAYYLPSKLRRVWQCMFLFIQVGCVSHNYNAGIRIRF